MHDPWMLVETTRVTEFEYYFACTNLLSEFPMQGVPRSKFFLSSKILIVFDFVLQKVGKP